MRYRVVNYQVYYLGQVISMPYPFEMAEKIALYIELKYDYQCSIIRLEESDDDYWTLGRIG